MNDKNYIGWVPCVIGRLLFEYSDCGLGKKHCFADINHVDSYTDSDNYDRIVIISSLVDWKDHDNEGHFGKWNVILIGEVDSKNKKILGNVYLSLEKKSFEKWDSIKEALRGLHRRALRRDSIRPGLEKLKKDLGEMDDLNFHNIEFLLDEHGLVILKYIDDEKLSAQEEMDGTSKIVAIRQAYYYIKYSFHKHQHHDDTAESLTNIHGMNRPKEKIGDHLIGDLRKSLVILKRSFDICDYKNLHSARGITSYALSLIESCYECGYLDEAKYKHNISYFNNIASSLNASEQLIEKNVSTAIKTASNARSIILFVFAIVAPLTILYKDQIMGAPKPDGVEQVPSYFIDIFSRIVSSDINLIGSAVVIILLFVCYQAIHFKFGRMFFAFRWVNRLIVYIAQKASIWRVSILILIFLVGFVLVGGAINGFFSH